MLRRKSWSPRAVGVGLLGFGAGTGVAAAGEGHRDAVWGIAGMMTGAVAYIVAYPAVTAMTSAFPKWGKVTLAQVTSTSPWIWVAALVLAAAIAYMVDNTREHAGPVSKGRPARTSTLMALESR